jgi:hypothetical protein
VPRSEAGPGSGCRAAGGAVGGDGGFSPIEVAVRSPERAGGPDGIRSAFELTYPQAAAWALVGCVTGFGLSLVGERSSGTLTRLAVAPIRRESVVVGKALACFVAAMVVLGAQRVLFMLPFFGVRGGDPVLEAVTLVLVAFAFTGVMAALATVATSTGGAEGAVRATLLILALLAGRGAADVFPGLMRLVTMASPFRWAIAALEGSTWRGWTAGELAGTWGVLGDRGCLGDGFWGGSFPEVASGRVVALILGRLAWGILPDFLVQIGFSQFLLPTGAVFGYLAASCPFSLLPRS